MLRRSLDSVASLAFVASFSFVALACSSSNGDAGSGDSDVDAGSDVVGDTKKDTRPADDTAPPDDVGCPAIGSACPDGAFVGCDSEWKGVNRWECHGGKWCAEPGVPPAFSAAGCPTTVPTAGDACTPPSGPSGYQWCGYACADGEVHAMVCAGGFWCGDATSTCTIVTAPDAGSDSGGEVDAEGDAVAETEADAATDAVAETDDAGPDAAPETTVDALAETAGDADAGD